MAQNSRTVAGLLPSLLSTEERNIFIWLKVPGHPWEFKGLFRAIHRLFVLHEGKPQAQGFASIKCDSLTTYAASTSCAKAKELIPSQKIKTYTVWSVSVAYVVGNVSWEVPPQTWPEESGLLSAVAWYLALQHVQVVTPEIFLHHTSHIVCYCL